MDNNSNAIDLKQNVSHYENFAEYTTIHCETTVLKFKAKCSLGNGPIITVNAVAQVIALLFVYNESMIFNASALC